MKRLTKRCNGVVTYIGTSNEYETGQIPCEVNPQGIRELLNLVAAYEDTELTPEQCADAATIIESAFADDTSKADRIRELLKADRDGRVVVLPCQSGERVFALLDDQKYARECEVKHAVLDGWRKVFFINPVGSPGDAYSAPFGAFGKTVFLTREEAEKALEAREDGN